MKVLQSPYDLRKGQCELVDFIGEVISSGGVCLAHAPTGIGKTLAALLATLPQIPPDGKILYVVNRKNQIPIVLKELRSINRANGTDYRAVSFASKADLCRDPDVNGLGYAELLEACELRRRNGDCPYFNALFERGGLGGLFGEEASGRRSKSRTAIALRERILQEMPPPHRIDEVAQKIERDLGSKPVCIYELLKWIARDADVLIGTFWYSFHPVVAANLLRTLSLDRGNCILICDEAHNLPKFCRESLSHGLSSGSLRYALRELKAYSRSIEEIGISIRGMESFLRGFSELYSTFKFTPDGRRLPGGLVKISLKRKGISSFKGPVESLEAAGAKVLETKIKRGSPPRSNLATTGAFLRPFLLSRDPSFQRFCVLSRTRRGNPSKRLEIRSLDPAPLASKVLDGHKPTGARASVLMSGTLVPGNYYCDILGLQRAKHKEFPNVFPRQNRALFLDDSISLAWRSRNKDMYGRILQRMEIIRDNTPSGVMFFFPSYEVMNHLKGLYQGHKVLAEERGSTKRGDAATVLEEGGTVMGVMGASLSEGLDLPGLIDAVAIFGLPLEKISDLVRAGMKYYDAKFPGKGRDYFYYLPAVTKIVQSAGRAHRSREDKAALYVFDRRFCRNYLDSAPRWWQEEAVEVKDPSTLASLTRKFWS